MSHKRYKNTTVLILVDALRWDSILKDGLFIKRLSEKGISGSLIPPFAFKPDAAFFAGLYPEEYDGGTEYWFSPETSPFKFTARVPLLKMVDILPERLQLPFRLAVRTYAQMVFRYKRIRRQASPAKIPFKYLKYFDFSMKYPPFGSEFAPKPTIFDILRHNNKTWFFYGPPLHNVRAKSVLKRVKQLNEPFDFVFLFIGDLDWVGHKFGPESPELEEKLLEVDRCIEEIYNIFKQKYESLNLIVFGDHGMVKVKKTLDIEVCLRRLNLIPGKDYIYFLDSTLARFWFKNEKARGVVSEMLASLKSGRIIDKEWTVKYRIRYPHNKFGELMFWVNSGVLILPNFFQGSTLVKGMHGYPAEARDNHSAFIVNIDKEDLGIRINTPLDMVDLFPTILRLMNLEIPEGTHGRDIVTRAIDGEI
ncbi:MAG: hypothetical protein DRG83_01195 [Deltaproteobacteria bacterium]|nr:MAG: hypothetical protein DRG83_01195 [Deltaproteobacteria bacterium]